MGNGASATKINFEDMQKARADSGVVVISTLPTQRQSCLIMGTLSPDDETARMNEWLKSVRDAPLIVVYGECSTDDSAAKKYLQLVSLGFPNVAIYPGGLFEWLLLQDVYGAELFPTRGDAPDILLYRGASRQRLLRSRR